MRWGLYTTGGLLVSKHGLSPYAQSACAAGPTGAPRSPLFGAKKFSQPLHRLNYRPPTPMTETGVGNEIHCDFPADMNEHSAKRLSYHDDYSNYKGAGPNPYVNPLTNRGPCEGRPSDLRSVPGCH